VQPIISRKEFEKTARMINRLEQEGILTPDMSYSINGIEKKSTIEDRAIRALVVEEINKQTNIESIAEKCLEYMDKDFVQEEEVDDDWLYTFRDSVKNISSEELQAIWAKLLANEIQSPSSYCLRTLNTLKNMNSYEAEVFKKFIKLTITDKDNTKRFSTRDVDILRKYNINKYIDIKLLEEIGLIQEGAALVIYPGDNLYFIDDIKLLNIFNDTDSEEKLNVYITTQVGTELASIVTGLDNSINLDYIKDFMKKINENNGYKIEIGENYKVLEDERIYVQTKNILYNKLKI
jgi:hypothetical protein